MVSVRCDPPLKLDQAGSAAVSPAENQQQATGNKPFFRQD
jgi:hypothetical protein